jgi:ubiquinone/menaquinone biosynthesis C-methylase UbiE
MVDLRTLMPAERARQLGHPEGEIGVAIAESLNTLNRGVNEAVFQRLGLEPGCRVLELGFGNGHLLPILMGYAEGIRYVGIEISATMVEEAARFNHALVASSRATFVRGLAEAIPFAQNSFDRAFAVAVVYFLPDPVRALAEIHRVLRPSGRCTLVSVHPETAASIEFARPEFGFRVYDAEKLITLHREAGFDHVVVEPYEELVARQDGSTWRLRAYLIVAET